MSDIGRYDRQIRAWGFETQRRLEGCKFLFVGINDSSTECIKNLVLAGSRAIDVIQMSDQALPNFFFSLNPMCSIRIFDAISKINTSDGQYGVVCTFDAPQPALASLHECSTLFLTCNGSSCVLNSGSPYSVNSDQAGSMSPLIQTIFGGLISQMIVDNLPPLSSPISVSLIFDQKTLSSKVVSL